MSQGDGVGGVYTVSSNSTMTVQPPSGAYWHVTTYTTQSYSNINGDNDPAIRIYKYDGSTQRSTGVHGHTNGGDEAPGGLGLTSFYKTYFSGVRSITLNNSVYVLLENNQDSSYSCQMEGQQLK